MRERVSGDRLAAAWTATQATLPAGWELDGVRCASAGLAPHERSDRWLAVARGPDDTTLEGEGLDAVEALADLLAHLRRRSA